MPELLTNKKFIKDIEKIRNNAGLCKKIARTVALLGDNPMHPGLHIERIVNVSGVWSARVDKKYRISFEPLGLTSAGTPDWTCPVKLLRVLSHDDLYKSPF